MFSLILSHSLVLVSFDKVVESFVFVVSLFVVAPIVHGNFVFGPCFVIEYLLFFLVLQSSR